MPPQLSCIIERVNERNSYFGHPENVLVAMLVDSNQEVREEAVNAILDKRQKSSDVEQPIRKFIKPKLNFNASSYHEMADIQSIEPPVTRKMSDIELKSCIENEENVVKNAVHCIPNNTQAVERYAQLVSQTSKRVVGAERRIFTTIASRAILPAANSKKDYAECMNTTKK